MSIVFDNDTSYKPWKVIRAGQIDTKHRHYGQAEEDVKTNGGDEIRYVNSRGFWTTVWKPKPTVIVVDDPAYL